MGKRVEWRKFGCEIPKGMWTGSNKKPAEDVKKRSRNSTHFLRHNWNGEKKVLDPRRWKENASSPGNQSKVSRNGHKYCSRYLAISISVSLGPSSHRMTAISIVGQGKKANELQKAISPRLFITRTVRFLMPWKPFSQRGVAFMSIVEEGKRLEVSSMSFLYPPTDFNPFEKKKSYNSNVAFFGFRPDRAKERERRYIALTYVSFPRMNCEEERIMRASEEKGEKQNGNLLLSTCYRLLTFDWPSLRSVRSLFKSSLGDNSCSL